MKDEQRIETTNAIIAAMREAAFGPGTGEERFETQVVHLLKHFADERDRLKVTVAELKDALELACSHTRVSQLRATVAELVEQATLLINVHERGYAMDSAENHAVMDLRAAIERAKGVQS